MIRTSDGELLATCNQLLIHVSLETRRSCEPEGEVLAKITALGEAQAKLPRPASMNAR
jgi:carnitine 3-dehydrogenase